MYAFSIIKILNANLILLQPFNGNLRIIYYIFQTFICLFQNILTHTKKKWQYLKTPEYIFCQATVEAQLCKFYTPFSFTG